MDKANGLGLYSNLLQWLAQPSMTTACVYQENNQRTLPMQNDRYNPPVVSDSTLAQDLADQPALNSYKGLIGAQSTYTNAGYSTVASYCNVGKASGYSFLVFAEAYASMTSATWSNLVSDCANNSNSSFTAVPGLMITGPAPYFSDQYVVFNLPSFPTQSDISGWSPLMFNYNYPTIAVTQPDGTLSAWTQMFYSGIAVKTYNGSGTLLDDGASIYRSMVKSDYRLIPISVCEMTSSSQVSSFSGAATMVWVNSLAGVPAALESVYSSGYSYVSQGPVITNFALASGPDTASYAGALTVPDGRSMKFGIGCSSTANLQSVNLYAGSQLLQTFIPSGKTYSTTFDATSTQQNTYTLQVTDVNGKTAVSNLLRTYNPVLHTPCA